MGVMRRVHQSRTRSRAAVRRSLRRVPIQSSRIPTRRTSLETRWRRPSATGWRRGRRGKNVLAWGRFPSPKGWTTPLRGSF